MPAIDLGDAEPTYQNAVDEARASFDKGVGAAQPSAPVAAPPPLPAYHKHGQRAAPPTDPTPEMADASQAGPDDLAHPNLVPAPPPPPTEGHEDNGNPFEWSTFKHFLRDEFKGTGEELENVAPRIAAKWGGWLTDAATGGAFLLDKGINKIKGNENSRLADSVIEFKKNYVDPAVEYWTPPRAAVTGEGEGSGGAAAALGSGLEVAPNIFMGTAGLVQLVSKAFSDTGIDEVEKNHTISTAIGMGTVDAVANLIQARFGVIPTIPVLKRVMASIGIGDLTHIASNLTKQVILTESGYQDKIDPLKATEGLGEATITNAVFGLTPTHGKKEETTKGGPTAPPPPAPEAAGVTPPPGPAGTPGAEPAPPGEPAPPVSAVPDKPSREPTADLREQLRDMNDPQTPRTGVLIPNGGVAQNADGVKITNQMKLAAKQGRVATLPQGLLILKTKAAKDEVQKRLDAGEDPQSVIGSVTGAGSGKSPDQTVVVQGRTPTGEVVTESAVKPEQVTAAKVNVEDQGKTPVVLTPEAAVARREALVKQEDTDVAGPVAGAAVESQNKDQAPPAEPTTVSQKETSETTINAEPEAAAPTMGMFKPAKGAEVPVHIEEGAPEGKVRVRPIDTKTGEPAERTIDVPKEQVRTGGENKPGGEQKAKEGEPPAEPQAAVPAQEKPPAGESKVAGPEAQSEPVAAEPAAKPAVEQAPKAEKAETPAAANSKALATLSEALATHEQQEKVPEGEKRVKLSDRQDNASAFAFALRHAAAESKGVAPDEVVARANDAAKAAEKLTLKSKEATDKGRGTGHGFIDAVVAEMHKAARVLLGKARPGDEEVVAPKAAELKRKIAAKKAKLAEATAEPAVVEKPKAPPKKVEKIEVPVNKKYEDQIVRKPKVASAETQNEGRKLLSDFMAADHGEEADAARAKVRKFLEEQAGDNFDRAEIDKTMHFLEAQREEVNPKPTKMSDTVEPESSDLEGEYKEPATSGISAVYRPAVDYLGDLGTKLGKIKQAAAERRLQDEWAHTSDNLMHEGLFDYIKAHVNTGKPLGAHGLLERLISQTETPILRSLLMATREHAPDFPMYFVDKIHIPRSGEELKTAAGLFDPNTRTLQVDINRALQSRRPGYAIQTIVHEIWHSATSYEIGHHPTGVLAMRLENALDILRDRMIARYGKELVNQHIDYFNDRTGNLKQPENFNVRKFYGLTNIHELMSEVWSNPDFVREIAESEDWASPNEKAILPPKRTLIQTIVRAIGEFFGVKDARLLQHIMDVSMDVAQSQAARWPGLMAKNNADFHNKLPETVRNLFGANALESARAARGLANLRDEPLPFRGEPRLRQFMEDNNEPTEPVDEARRFMHTVKGKSLDAIRQTVIALKTVGQIYRDHMTDFGGDTDPHNPLRELQEANISKNVMINKLSQITRPVAEKWLTLNKSVERAMSRLMIDTTQYKIDPRLDIDKQSLSAKSQPGFEARFKEYKARWDKLGDAGREVYDMAEKASKRMLRELRKAGVDTALHSFDMDALTEAQRGLLYGAKSPEVYDSIIGEGKLIDLGDRNEKLKAALKDFAGMSEIDGPYFHLGRQGEYVVQAEPEGTREFASKEKAQEFADMVSKLSPGSYGKLAERGGKFVVDFKAKYVSMHETRGDAEAEQKRLTDAGLNPGLVTQKTMGKESAPLSFGMKELMAEAERKIQRHGADEGTEAAIASLRSAFLQMTAARSAYAGSRLARKNFGGVKPEDMMRNFSENVSSTMWHAAQLRTVFDQAAALAKVRSAARDAHAENVSQDTMYRRGEVVKALGKHALDEVQNYGHKAPFNAMMAKLGFMSYLASPSHAAIWMTQNFTTGIPVAGGRWGYGKALPAFRKGMSVTIGPAMKSAVQAALRRGGTSSDIHEAILKAIRADKTVGKWAQGENSPIQQLIDRGTINHGYSNELGALSRGDSPSVARLFEWARLLPSMADAFNRVSTAIAGLEMTGGDIRKTADFVEEIHADYSQQNKPLAFKKVNRVWGANSLTMFKTYAQEMIHLTYGNLKASFVGPNKAEAAKTFAGLVIGNALFAGVYGAVGLEPLRLALYAYHKIADEEGEVWNLKTAIHGFLVDHFGKTAGNALAYGPIPHLLGGDLSSRMGLSDLFFHDPPDLLSSDKEMWKNFIFNEAGPMPQLLANNVSGFVSNMQQGHPFQALSAIIPIKAYQDAAKAAELYNHGKTDSMGGQMTKPSAGDALIQALGFKPATVAEAQEKASIRIEQAKESRAAKDSIIKAYAAARTPEDKKAVMDRVNKYNKTNPAEPLRGEELIKALRRQAETTQGFPSKDPRVRAKTNF